MAGAQRMHYQGMKAVDPQRMSRNAGDTGQGTRVKPVFWPASAGDRANKHRRSAVEIPSVAEVSAPAQLMQRAAGNDPHGGDEQRGAERC